MKHIQLSYDKALGFVSAEKIAGYKNDVKAANEALHNGTGKGNDFLGWLNLPSSIDEAHLTDVENTARIREVRKTIARMKTIIREREIGINH